MADASNAPVAPEETVPAATSFAGPWQYPFGPFTDAEDAKAGAKFRRSLEQEGGIDRAIHRLCTHDCMSMDVEDLVARNFLIERADRTYPALLDALRRADDAPGSDANSECLCAIDDTERSAVCSGYDIGGTGPALDAHPLAVERRALAQRALAKALDRGGPRAEMAMDLLLQIGRDAYGEPSPPGCTGLAETLRAATPALVKRLGAPRAPPRLPRSVEGDEPDWARALQGLSFWGADRAVAERPVAAFLADDETAPLAALALARMGADVTAVVPRLARILDGIALHDGPYSRRDWDDLEQSGDVLDALRTIGKPARSALPNVAALVLRSEVPACHTHGASKYVQVVRAIATDADADVAVPCLAGLLVCPGSDAPVVQALGEFGAAARAPLLSVLRDDARTIRERLGAVTALRQAGPEALADPDRRLSALLQAKSTAWDELIHTRSALATTAASEVGRCRAEVGLTPGPAPAAGYSWDLATCLSKYLCGPTMETYLAAMELCLFGASGR